METTEEGQSQVEIIIDEDAVNRDAKNERIAARRMRIKRRMETLMTQPITLGDENGKSTQDPITDRTKSKSPVRFQLEKSTEILNLLALDGLQYITNVQTVNIEREVSRREREGTNQDKILQRIQQESSESQDYFDLIENKWTEILMDKDALQLHEDLQIQRGKCDQLIHQKDSIISMLNEEIQKAELAFNLDQLRQIEDVETLKNRIEKQTDLMRKTYQMELKQIEAVIDLDRADHVNQLNRKWDELYQKRNTDEQSNVNDAEKMQNDCEMERETLRRNFEEWIRQARIEKERNVDAISTEFERIKTWALMNSEKLDYNYQILKKREDENIIVKSQQKRRINELQDEIMRLKRQLADYLSSTEGKMTRIQDEIRRMHQSRLEYKKKSDHLAKCDDRRFCQVWDMNKTRADDLLRKLLEIDRYLYEQQIGRQYPQKRIQNVRKEDIENYVNAVQKLTTLNDPGVESKTEPGDLIENENYRLSLKHIMEKMSEKCDFLVEEQLLIILRPYARGHQNLIRIDNVFNALGLDNREDIDLLMDFFFPYTFCEICTREDSDPNPIPGKQRSDCSNTVECIEEDSDLFSGTPLNFYGLLEGECKGPQGVYEEIRRNTERVRNDGKIGFNTCKSTHPLTISSVYILRALNDFMDDYNSYMAKQEMAKKEKVTTLTSLLSKDDVKSFWDKYRGIFKKDDEDLWDHLFDGLQKYHKILKERKVISEDVVRLRHQNTELKHLLANYKSILE